MNTVESTKILPKENLIALFEAFTRDADKRTISRTWEVCVELFDEFYKSLSTQQEWKINSYAWIRANLLGHYKARTISSLFRERMKSLQII